MKRSRIGNIWIVMGLLLIVAALSLTLYNIWEADRADRASQSVVKSLEQQIQIEEQSSDPAAMNLTDEREMPTIEIDGYRYIGYLVVPVLDLKLPVMEEWDYDRLKIAPCCYSGTVYKNNLVIAGHNYRRHFSPIRWQGLGTEVDFIDVEGNLYRYEISNIETLKPEQTEEMTADSEARDLTLFTCSTGGQSRVTVRCTKID